MTVQVAMDEQVVSLELKNTVNPVTPAINHLELVGAHPWCDAIAKISRRCLWLGDVEGTHDVLDVRQYLGSVEPGQEQRQL
jgi:hypothetical protein